MLSALFKKVSKGLSIVDIHGIYNIKGRRGMLNWNVCAQEYVEQGGEEGKVEKVKKLKIFANASELKPNMKIKESMFPPSL